jgi:chromate transport protein ChrA
VWVGIPQLSALHAVPGTAEAGLTDPAGAVALMTGATGPGCEAVTTTATAASKWLRFRAALPMRTALGAVAVVWLLGCVWRWLRDDQY